MHENTSVSRLIQSHELTRSSTSASKRAAARWAIMIAEKYDNDLFTKAAIRQDGGEDYHPVYGRFILSIN